MELVIQLKMFKQGVLGFSEEFGDLVNEVKAAAQQGSLFTTTRDDGLEACEQILNLDLEVKLQFVLLYLRCVEGT